MCDVDYTEARDAFFQPRPDDSPARALDWSSPARALRDAIEPLATVCFWSEPAYDAYAARGLDFLQGYVWGRASALGEPEPGVVAAAFGVFEPGLVGDLYSSGRAACSLADVRAAKVEGVVGALGTVLGEDPDGLADTVAALRGAVDAADTTGRAFSAGARSIPWPDEPLAQLWHACTILRENRGDGHLAATVAAGLDGVQANVLTELWVGWEPLAYTGSRAWAPEVMQAGVEALTARGLVADGALTADGRALREELETTTDRLVQPVVDALGDGLTSHVERLDGWAQQVVDHGWFPPDPYKRASG